MNILSSDILYFGASLIILCDCAKDLAIKRGKRGVCDIRLIENSFSPVYHSSTSFERVTVFKPFASVREKIARPTEIDFRSRNVRENRKPVAKLPRNARSLLR